MPERDEAMYLTYRRHEEPVLDDPDDDEPEEPEREGGRLGVHPKIGLDLLRHTRTIFICEEVSPRLSQRVIPQILWLDWLSHDPIKVFLNTPGGTADDGFAIHDILKFGASPVYTICNGLTASAGTIILLAAPKKQRLTLPNSRIMIHQPAGGARGRASDIEITAKEIARLRARANQLIANECDKPLEQVETDTNRDNWMTPEEACAYGLCSRVISAAGEIETGG
jgi:ATP-dependent Clp protease protease subunit